MTAHPIPPSWSWGRDTQTLVVRTTTWDPIARQRTRHEQTITGPVAESVWVALCRDLAAMTEPEQPEPACDRLHVDPDDLDHWRRSLRAILANLDSTEGTDR